LVGIIASSWVEVSFLLNLYNILLKSQVKLYVRLHAAFSVKSEYNESMSDIILYPTETIYALGVNPFDASALHALCDLKKRSGHQSMSWLVRSAIDIDRYAEITPLAYDFIEKHLPGPLTIILKAKPSVPQALQALDGTVSFRISSDPIAQELIENYMEKHDAPLTCTSANVHGEVPKQTPTEILLQFKDRAKMITKIIDDGPRNAEPSTIVRIIGAQKTILRQGSIVL